MRFLLRPSDIRTLRGKKGGVETSPDCGLTTKKIMVDGENITLPDGTIVVLPNVKEDEKTIFALFEGNFVRIRFTGEETGQVYELVETAGRPMLKVSATPFHKWDFIKRIEADAAAGKMNGDVLDAGTGLGYTAIAASKSAARVITVENDPHVLRVQELNPWSDGLHKENIEQVNGDVCEYAKTCDVATFDAIILDGGTPRSSGNFFSQTNYDEMRRILKKGGTLYHYLPDHGMTRGRDFPAEVIARLRKAGFSKVERYAKENYVVAS
ncbi:TPA: methyltransferase domain-containing protein [Candidatus Woesearchaeota archaeon]|nr:methyltransferase domain-containing protein [Candidatus Woesearchaeota archaeon]